MKAISTKYSNTQFRSRLEAKWAAFFDHRDWRWTYEPFDMEGYIPDFLLQLGDRTALVEVKPVVSLTGAKDALCTNKMQKAVTAWCGGHGDQDFLLLGAAGFDEPCWGGGACIGAMVQGRTLEEEPCWGANECMLHWCDLCNSWIYIDMILLWVCPACGKGGKEVTKDPVSDWMFNEWWREAGNQVQWRRPHG